MHARMSAAPSALNGGHPVDVRFRDPRWTGDTSRATHDYIRLRPAAGDARLFVVAEGAVRVQFERTGGRR